MHDNSAVFLTDFQIVGPCTIHPVLWSPEARLATDLTIENIKNYDLQFLQQ